MFVFELPKWAHPDFQGYTKPKGSVEIDWNNPLTRGLHHAFLHNAIPNGAHDLVQDIVFPFSDGGDGDDLSLKGDASHGLMTNFRRDMDEFVGFGDGVMGKTWYPPVNVTTTEVSTLQLVRYLGPPTEAQEKTIFSTSNASDFGTTNTYTSTLIKDQQWHQIGIRFSKPKDNFEIFEDGVSLGFSTTRAAGLNLRIRYNPNVSQWGVRDAQSVGNGLRIGNHDQNNDDNWEGDIALGLFWTRYLSPAEYAELARNPYQVLKPAVPLFLVTPAEEAGGGDFIQSIAGYGGIAGKGGTAGRAGGIAG